MNGQTKESDNLTIISGERGTHLFSEKEAMHEALANYDAILVRGANVSIKEFNG